MAGVEPIELDELDPEAQTRRGKEKRTLPTRSVEAADDGYFVSSGVDARTTLTSAASGEPIIDLNNVHKTYLLGVEGVPALRGVSLTIARGEFVCVFGTSGGGKTSLLNVIGTIDKPTKGDIKVAGTRINARTTDKELADLRLHKLGFVFQTFNLLSALTAIENVEMPMILANKLTRAEVRGSCIPGLTSLQRRTRAKALLERVGMGARLDHLPSQLSGGEQQRVTIARAIANQPDVLLLDEPTGDLDTVNTAIVLRLLLELNREGITLVMVTHDVGLKFFADRVIWMRDGKIQRVEQVTPDKQADARARLNAAPEASGAQKVEQGGNGISFSNTVVRRPRDYHTYSALEVPSALPAANGVAPAPASSAAQSTSLPVVSP